IERDHLAVGLVEQGRRVAAAAEGAVEIALAASGLQRVNNFVDEHGNVPGHRATHVSPPSRPRTKAAMRALSASRRACQRLGFHSWNLSPLPTSITPSLTSSTSANSAGSEKRPSGSIGMVRAEADR